MNLPNSYIKNRRLENLVENQISYTLNNAEMHVFETYQQADQVLLSFNQPVLASMLRGKKVMHMADKQSFDFLPGESLILPASELMCIDFPDADLQNPTQCLAMTISEDKIKEIVLLMNEQKPKADGQEWRFTDYNFHFTNDTAIYQIIQRLLFLFTEHHAYKDVFADFMLKELVIRILQAETKKIYTEKTMSLSGSNRIAYIIQYIRKNLTRPLTIQELSEKAYMSESNFYRVFKNEMGVSPVDFINTERIKLAMSLLHDPNKQVKDVYMECGFNSLSYFTRLFKRKNNKSPKEYQSTFSRLE
ncbi:MAG: AraC family transcriptional regulator [Flammeovirgaceae bacterium]